MKANTNELYVIFLLKRNVWTDIIKTILGYPPIAMLETLKEWKVVIISVGQEYKFIKEWHDYKTETETIYGEWELSMDIGNSKENFKDGKLRCFNYNLYKHMARDCWRPKKENNNKKFYKYKQAGHIAKDYKTEQKIKNQSVQNNTETDAEDEDNKMSFGKDCK